MKEQNFTEKTLMCECGSEILNITHFKEDYVSEFWFSMFRNYNYKNSFISRIKYAWWHLKTGKKHIDQITLSEDKAKQLASFIYREISKSKN